MSYALVTGSGKGIGRSIAIELARRNYDLLLTCLDAVSLEHTAQEIREIYGVDVQELALDLSDTSSAKTLLEWSVPYHDQLVLVVNNAGYGLNNPFEKLGLDEQLNMINVNVKAQVSLTHLFLPILRSQSRAWLLNVCSTTAYQPVPYMAIYAASKAFVLSFNRSLHYELRHSTVSHSVLSPGPTDTDFVKRAGMRPHTLKLASRFNMTADEVAKIAVKGLFSGKEEIVPGLINKLNALLPRFFPVGLVRRIAGSIYESKTAREKTITHLTARNEPG